MWSIKCHYKTWFPVFHFKRWVFSWLVMGLLSLDPLFSVVEEIGSWWSKVAHWDCDGTWVSTLEQHHDGSRSVARSAYNWSWQWRFKKVPLANEIWELYEMSQVVFFWKACLLWWEPSNKHLLDFVELALCQIQISVRTSDSAVTVWKIWM